MKRNVVVYSEVKKILQKRLDMIISVYFNIFNGLLVIETQN